MGRQRLVRPLGRIRRTWRGEWLIRQGAWFFFWMGLIHVCSLVAQILLPYTATTIWLRSGVYVLAIAALVLVTLRRMRPVQRLVNEQRGLVCPRCLFVLTGLGYEGVCPECGRPFKDLDLAAYWRKRLALK